MPLLRVNYSAMGRADAAGSAAGHGYGGVALPAAPTILPAEPFAGACRSDGTSRHSLSADAVRCGQIFLCSFLDKSRRILYNSVD